MKRNPISVLIPVGLVLSLAWLAAACKDDGPTVSDVCRKFCDVVEECWDYNLDSDETKECVEECKDDFEDDYNGDMAECKNEAIACGNCFYSTLLSEDCDEEEADDECDDKCDDLEDCWEDNHDDDYSEYSSY